MLRNSISILFFFFQMKNKIVHVIKALLVFFFFCCFIIFYLWNAIDEDKNSTNFRPDCHCVTMNLDILLAVQSYSFQF